MPDIRVTCPTCSTQLEVDAAHEGEEVECGHCLQVFVAATKKDGSSASGRKTRGAAPRSGSARDRADEEDDDRPRRRRRDDDDDDDDDDDYRPRRGDQIPSQPVAGMLLGGGIWALLMSFLAVLSSSFLCCAWPGVWFAVVWGILAIVNASSMFNKRFVDRPKALLIMQIIQIVNFDVVNLALGIVGLASGGGGRGRRDD
ncbi:hypothetical protein GobsT_35580 [Gemmata obscuriglobus]|uniref:Zinc finger/thioredoxin putative domain-containing protein n=1 Tax=Gemmata obscuriglobus TaxID=114 RepID=A0A2Z3H5B5_9BACT|nr:MJ0042-type zinc finger domain-containing protein [Gemmata obscuriglobus]AWM38315.1 hypothetical protein C1280_15850 [Gemmata obscuriglobus]QEG28771.1 hypothetical protein GobsT_35580 [Gemmata obscuriglobus]VTS07110.1 unnamed protein product [Gemmata obscuriglobus UQM 2246]